MARPAPTRTLGGMRRLLPVCAGLLTGGCAVHLVRGAEAIGPVALAGVLLAVAGAGGWAGRQLLQRRAHTVLPIMAGGLLALVVHGSLDGVRWDVPVLASNAALGVLVLHTARRPRYRRPALRLIHGGA
jgi:hypothetical protein